MAKLKDLLDYSRKSLTHRKLRSWLTIIGVVIGIAAIVMLIALAQGLDRAVRDEITSFGTNFIQILPGNIARGSFSFAGGKGALYQQDADSIKHIPGIESSSAILSPGFATYEYKNSSITAILTGIDPDGMKQFVKTVGLSEGALPKSNDLGSAVIGDSFAKKSFKEEIHVGKTIYINDQPFRIAGIFNPSAAVDSDIYITIPAARRFLADTEDPNRIYSILIVTREGEPVQPIADQVTKIIANNHRVKLDNLDFTVFTADSILSSIGVIFGLLSLFLGMVALISIVVGAIGIANSMFTSVMERTREIGILKAIGASSSTIVRLFLLEAGIIGVIGGILGILAAYLLVTIGKIIAKSAFSTDLPVDISIELVVFSLVLSFVVGIASGYFPARQASRMEPVEALRYE